MKSLSQQMELAGANNDKIGEAWDRVSSWKPSKPMADGKPRLVGDNRDFKSKGGVVVHDMPLYELGSRRSDRKFAPLTVFDIILDHTGDFNLDEIKPLLDAGTYSQLPAPLCPKEAEVDVPMTINYNIQQGDDDKYVIVKMITFLRAPKMSLMKDIIQGTGYAIDPVPDRFGMMKTTQQLFEHLDGVKFVYWQWHEAARALGAPVGDVEKEKARIKKGIQHIRDECPRGDMDSEQTEWVECELVDPESPIFGFRRELISTVLKAQKDKNHYALKQEYYPLLLPDLDDTYRSLIYRLIPLLITTTLLCIGEPKYGKTPLMTILAFAIARYHAAIQSKAGAVVQATVRIATEIDFFRGEVGLKWVPCLFDDGDMKDQRPRVLKAFFDPSMMEAMAWVRWGAAKFVRGQARFGGDNNYCAEAEPSDADWERVMGDAKKSTNILIEMIRPAFPPNMSTANVFAMLKRCTVMLNTVNWVYVRVAGLGNVVERFPIAHAYITADAGRILGAWHNTNELRDPEEFANLLGYEQRVVSSLMEKKTVAVDAASASTGPAAVGAPDGPPAMKRGRFLQLKSSATVTLDLTDSDCDAPPPPPDVAPAAPEGAPAASAPPPVFRAFVAPATPPPLPPMEEEEDVFEFGFGTD